MKHISRILAEATITLILITALLPSHGAAAAPAAISDGGNVPSQNITDQMIQGLDGNGGEAVALPSAKTVAVETVVGRIIQAFLSVFGIIFLGLMVYGGYKWMIAQGREEEIKKAKDIIRSSIIGLAIALSAYAIALFIVARFYQAAGGT